MEINRKKLGLILFSIGFIGILSLLTIDITIDNLPPEVLMTMGPETYRFVMLLNPFVLLIIAVVAGSLVIQNTGLHVPFIESALAKKPEYTILSGQLKWAIPIGLLAGTFMFFYARWFEINYSEEFSMLSTNFKPSAIMKILYGGITEELLLRYGLMTLFVWFFWLIVKKLNNWVYWIAIILAAFLFGVGHLGVLFQSIENPSTGMIFYVVTGNAFGGLFLGWLYWKKGLESSMFAHICMHLAMIFFLAVI